VDGPRLARENVTCRTELACSHVSGLFTQSGGTAGPDGVREPRPHHSSGGGAICASNEYTAQHRQRQGSARGAGSKITLVSADGTGHRSHTGGLRDGNPRRLLRHTPPGTRTVLGPTVRRPPTSLRQPTVGVSSFNHHQPAVMAITKWSIQAPSSKKSPASRMGGGSIAEDKPPSSAQFRVRNANLAPGLAARASLLLAAREATLPVAKGAIAGCRKRRKQCVRLRRSSAAVATSMRGPILMHQRQPTGGVRPNATQNGQTDPRTPCRSLLISQVALISGRDF
jgi:hypothetical protein